MLFQVMVMETREQAKAKAQNMEDNKKKIPVVQAKMKLMNAQNKIKATMTQIRKAVEEFSTLEDTTDKEVAANCINFSWKRLISDEEDLKVATEKLAEILSEADPTIIEADAVQQIERNNDERDKLIIDWETFIKQHQEQMKTARGMVEQSSVNIQVQSTRVPFVQRRFSPDQSLKPKLLNDSASLLEVKDFIMEFKNYIQSGFNIGEAIPAGHYVQMRNVLEHSWIERLDRRDAMKKDLKELCDLLHEEAEKKYPKHQRRINLLKMRKHQNESSTEFLRRVRRNLEVAEIETMTPAELGMHIFIESSNQIIEKLAIDELQKKSPSLDDLENAVQTTEV